MEGALVEAVKVVPGLAFGAFVFWLVAGLWKASLAEQAEQRESHRATVDGVVLAFRESVAEVLSRSDARQEKCMDACRAAINELRRQRS